MDIKRRGRPPGVRNGQGKTSKPILPPSSVPLADYRHSDPDALVARQLSILDMAQQSVRAEIADQLAEGVGQSSIDKCVSLAGAIDKAIASLARSAKLADELAARMSPQQLLEAALRKLEGQDEATLTYAIRRLREARTRQAPEAKDEPAVDSLAALGTGMEQLDLGLNV